MHSRPTFSALQRFLRPGVNLTNIIHLMFNSVDAHCQPEEGALCGAGQGGSGGNRRSGLLPKCKGVKKKAQTDICVEFLAQLTLK